MYLDHLITKNVNDIVIQIYADLIAYLILKLLEIPQVWGSHLIHKIRYIVKFCDDIQHFCKYILLQQACQER